MTNQTTIRQDYQLVNSKYKLNTSEMKFIISSLSQIKKDDKEFCTYEIKVSELEQKLQSEQNSTRLKQFAKKLMSKPLEVPTDNGGWIIFSWFSKIQYVPEERKFIVRFDEDLKPYLLDLQKRFVHYNLKYILPLTSNYSIRIYQLLKEYEKLKIRYIDVAELQELLQVPKSYKRYDNFKNKILKVAEKELKEHTDIFFTFEEEKEGKKVTRLVFRIHKNNGVKVVKVKSNDRLIAPKVSEDYSYYYGKNCYYNKTFYDNIHIIQKDEDEALLVTFKNAKSGKGDLGVATLKVKDIYSLHDILSEKR